jgi:hypothetical protein
MGNDLSQLPSYTDLVSMVQRQSGEQNEMEDQVKRIQDEAVKVIVERENLIQELQERVTVLQDELNTSEIKVTIPTTIAKAEPIRRPRPEDRAAPPARTGTVARGP